MAACAKNRCGNCGAELRARHLGMTRIGDSDIPIGYCESCNTFIVPVGADEKSYRERLAEAKAKVPKGWSVRLDADGLPVLRRGLPLRWLWTFPACAVVLYGFAWVLAHFTYLSETNQFWPIFAAILAAAVAALVCVVALCRLTARRYRLGRDALVVESLWLGFIPLLRRTFERTVITRGVLEERGRDVVAVWINGYARDDIWRGRSRAEADFVAANLFAPVDSGRCDEPLLCGNCGAAFGPADIDMPGHALVCPVCGATTTPGEAERARCLRIHLRDRPRGITDLRDGFDYREGSWRSTALGAALARFAAVATVAWPLAELVDRRSFACASACALILRLLPPVWFAVESLLAALLGRFGVHHLACADGRLVYFHGIGRFGRRIVLPLASIEGCTVMFRVACFSTDAQVPHAIGLVVKGERKARRIFRDCRPRFYHWAEGWLEAARQNCRTAATKGA